MSNVDGLIDELGMVWDELDFIEQVLPCLKANNFNEAVEFISEGLGEDHGYTSQVILEGIQWKLARYLEDHQGNVTAISAYLFEKTFQKEYGHLIQDELDTIQDRISDMHYGDENGSFIDWIYNWLKEEKRYDLFKDHYEELLYRNALGEDPNIREVRRRAFELAIDLEIEDFKRRETEKETLNKLDFFKGQGSK